MGPWVGPWAGRCVKISRYTVVVEAALALVEADRCSVEGSIMLVDCDPTTLEAPEALPFPPDVSYGGHCHSLQGRKKRSGEEKTANSFWAQAINWGRHGVNVGTQNTV